MPVLRFGTCMSGLADFLVETVTVHSQTPLCVLPGSWLKQHISLSVRFFRGFSSVLLG